MKRFAATLLPLGLIAAAGPAAAQAYGDYGRYDAPRTVSGDQYDYARVVRVDPVLRGGYAASGGRCYGDDRDYGYEDRDGDDRYGARGYDRRDRYATSSGYGDRYDDRYRDGAGTTTGRNVSAIVGGIAGAVLGSQVGGGSARYATAAVGSMVGGIAGREVYEASQRDRQPRPRITVCDPVREGGYSESGYSQGVDGYDVVYEYAGRQYTARTDHHPGDRIRVRVDVRPE